MPKAKNADFIDLMNRKKAIVIGAGISGLCAAYELRKRGFDVDLLERAPRAGGVIDTFCENGFKAESGTNSVMVRTKATLDFLDEIGLTPESSMPSAKKRFFVRYGKPRAVPTGLGAFVFTRLFTPLGKLRLLCEPFVKKAPDDAEDESVAQFTLRRLGREALDYAMDPFMGGVFGGNCQNLSVKHAFEPFRRFERQYGSVILGAIKSAASRKREGNYFKPMMVSFEGGMKTLVDRLSALMGDSLKTGAKIISIDSDCGGGWQVSWHTQTQERAENYDAMVFALPSYEISKLPLSGSLSGLLAPLAKIRYAKVATYTMGFAKKDVKRNLDGFGTLIPSKEADFSILGALYISSVFKNRAPDGCVAITSYIGGMRSPELADLPQNELRALVLGNLKKLLGVRGEPKFEKLWVWPHAIAQYELGYDEFLDTMQNAENALPNFALVGSYRGGVGVSACMENALTAAGNLAKRVEKEDR